MHSDLQHAHDETLLGLCRPGFENDLAAELNYHAAEQMVGGYPRTVPDSGYVLRHSQQGSMEALLGSGLSFARSLRLAAGRFGDIADGRIARLWPLIK